MAVLYHHKWLAGEGLFTNVTNVLLGVGWGEGVGKLSLILDQCALKPVKHFFEQVHTKALKFILRQSRYTLRILSKLQGQ